MKHPTPLRPQVRVDIDHWKDDATALSLALDKLSFITMHGDRMQQIEAANSARESLRMRGYPVQSAQAARFDVTVRTDSGYHSWTVIGRSSGDVMHDTLTHFGEQSVTIRVRPEA